MNRLAAPTPARDRGEARTDAQEHDTGRVRGTLHPEAQRIVYGAADDEADRAVLRRTSRIDRAHVLTLQAADLLTAREAVALIDGIAQMEREGYDSILGSPRPRGLYLVYEKALADRLGADIGGKLHTGRSRNDLGATSALLAVREQARDLVDTGARLLAALLGNAERTRDAVMPIHTHAQPAMPITYGYYLVGIALAVVRDLEAVRRAAFDHDVCPLGAHAVAGTNLPLPSDVAATALGFARGPVHAVDVIASRDTPMGLLSAAGQLGLTLSRLATDLQFWSTQEVGYLSFPDWLVGSSSAMPQKRNAFLLEHLKSRPTQALGAYVAAWTATKSAPFTNSIEVGTESMAQVGDAVDTIEDMARLATLVVAGASPRRSQMRRSAAAGFVNATAVANQLVVDGVPFRAAHHQVGREVERALAEGRESLEVDGLVADLTGVVAAARFGGGPGALARPLAEARAARTSLVRWSGERRAVEEQSERFVAEQIARLRVEAAHD